MKRLINKFEWYDKPHWHWPEHDEKLMQVNDWVSDLDLALEFVAGNSIAVQAGGACGVWPAYLAKRFKEVFTFEPVRSNYECLEQNVKHLHNVIAAKMGLSDDGKPIKLSLDKTELNNCGAFYAGNSGLEAPTTTIDDLELKACDLISLDLEGYEDKALIGAEYTLKRFKPVVMIEEKPLPHLQPNEHLKARKHLESIGYKEAFQIHRDVVFIYG